jgi:hypothetical protein
MGKKIKVKFFFCQDIRQQQIGIGIKCITMNRIKQKKEPGIGNQNCTIQTTGNRLLA